MNFALFAIIFPIVTHLIISPKSHVFAHLIISYVAKTDLHIYKQKFELKRNPFFLQLMGNLPEEELEMSTLAANMNGYAAELCPPKTQKQIDAKINDIIKKGWPILREK